MTNYPSNNGKQYWRSLDELADTPDFREFVRKEFPNRAAEMLDEPTRRHFLKFMAASFALAGMKGCFWPEEKIVPYARRPDHRIPGVPEQFATSMEMGGFATGLLMTSFDGRPVKAEGNPDHPTSLGSTNIFGQASVLELYDPDRSQHVVQRTDNQRFNRSWNDFDAFVKNHFSAMRKSKGKGLYVLSEASSSSSFEEMKSRMVKAFPQLKWYEYEPISFDNEREGTRLATGEPLHAQPKLNQAKVIVSLDADFLIKHPHALRLSKDFVEGRNPDSGMNRLYVVESNYSNTGAMADHRLPLQSGLIEHFAILLLKEILEHPSFQVPAWLNQVVSSLNRFNNDGIRPEFIKAVADDLVAHQRQGLVLAGFNQPASVHALVYFINHVLENAGNTITYTKVSDPERLTHLQAIQELTQEMEDGNVNTLVMFGGNPAYDAPADLQFGDTLKKVPHSVHLSLYDNETSKLCQWHIPRAHFLEAWGDARAFDGTYSTVQPLLYPLYHGKSAIELMAMLLDEAPLDGYSIVQRTVQSLFSPTDFDTFWQTLLHDGVLPNTRYQEIAPQVRVASIRQVIEKIPEKRIRYHKGNLEITFTPDSKVYDGRFANNGWLQELPDFHTKIAWDNAALLAPSTADELGIKTQDLIRLNYEGRSLEMVAYVLPGHAPYSITLPLGYGRAAAGRVGTDVGFNTYSLRSTRALHFDFNLTVEPVGKAYALATTQDHHAIDMVGMRERERRIGDLIREATLDEYKEHPEFAKHAGAHHGDYPLWREHEYNENKWGMAINLHSCTGCNACVTACQAENNIPVVGKEQVINGREMHWIRIDRYFAGDVNEPEIAHQPMTCVHCENAPCEQVCPVAATVHSEEGLNVMVYNRCIGTRYCSNNCPYKVRRFNFFNYHKNLEETEKMAFNPEVTVRSRGVMEKCTYCVQRIQNVKIQAKNEGREIRDGEITPACAQACPTNAIVFGDLNHQDSQVAKLHEQNRSYFVLSELNVKPRTAYIARVKNPNPELIDQTESQIKETHEPNNNHS